MLNFEDFAVSLENRYFRAMEVFTLSMYCSLSSESFGLLR